MSGLRRAQVLVTGGTGFVGSHLVRRLVGEGAVPHVLVQPGSSLRRLEDVRGDINLLRGDIANAAEVRACVKAARPEVVFHLAGVRKLDRDMGMIDRSLEVNLGGTVNLCKAIHEERSPVRCFIQTGSFEEYGAGPVPFDEEQREQPVSPYSASKVAATQFCQMLHRSLGFPVVVLRACHLYGPSQDTDMLIPGFITRCLDGTSLEITSGEQTRDFGYVSDIVEAYVLAATSQQATGEVINIGSGKEYTIREVAQRIVAATGGKAELRVGAVPCRPADARRAFGRTEKAKQLLGWSPKVDLEEGLDLTIASYRKPVG